MLDTVRQAIGKLTRGTSCRTRGSGHRPYAPKDGPYAFREAKAPQILDEYVFEPGPMPGPHKCYCFYVGESPNGRGCWAYVLARMKTVDGKQEPVACIWQVQDGIGGVSLSDLSQAMQTMLVETSRRFLAEDWQGQHDSGAVCPGAV